MPTISVIVPVYNVEEYLPACVDSVRVQTFEDFELILVDDGSPDNCGAMCDEYAVQDSRIRVIHQENQGLSGARNTGMDTARGEYITFIDSDDLVTRDYLQLLLTAIVDNRADISCIRMREIDEQSLLSDVSSFSSGSHSIHVLSGQDAVLSVYQGTGEVGISAWGKLARKALLDPHPFPLGMLHEDQAVIPIVLYEADRVSAIDAVCYYYRNRSSSIMHTSFKVNRFDNMKGLDTCIRFFTEQGNDVLAAAAKEAKKKVNALLVILAESSGAHDEIPIQYRMSRLKALYLCRKYTSEDTYTWYLSQLFPSGWVIHEYLRKIKQTVCRLLGRKSA